MELIAQHLKRGKLPDKFGVDRRSVVQFQHRANVIELRERICGVAKAFELSPQADEHHQLQQGRLASVAGELELIIAEAAGFALRNARVFLVASIPVALRAY